MTFDKPEHKQLFVDIFTRGLITFPSNLLGLGLEIQSAIFSADIKGSESTKSIEKEEE